MFIGFPKSLLSAAKVLDGQKNGEGAADKVSGADVGSRLRAPQAANKDLLSVAANFCPHGGPNHHPPLKKKKTVWVIRLSTTDSGR